MTIAPDNYISRQLNWDLTDRKSRRQDTLSLVHVTEANGNVYFPISPPGDTTGQLIVITIRVVEPGKKIPLTVNATDTPLSDAAAVSNYIRQDGR